MINTAFTTAQALPHPDDHEFETTEIFGAVRLLDEGADPVNLYGTVFNLLAALRCIFPSSPGRHRREPRPPLVPHPTCPG